MSIGTPQSLGTKQGTASDTLTLSASNNIQAGDLVVISVISDARAPTGISDGTNTYTKIVSATAPSGNGVASLWALANCAAVSSPSIVVTFGSSTSLVNVIAARVSGVSATDVSNSATGDGAPSVSSGTLSQASEILWGTLSDNTGTGSITATGSWTQIAALTQSGGFSSDLEYQIVNSTSSVTYAPTASSTYYAALIASFKGSTTTSFTGFNMPMLGM